MVNSTATHVHGSTIGSGVRHVVILIASTNHGVSFPEFTQLGRRITEKIVTTNSPLLTVKDQNSLTDSHYGVERAYNITTGEDITRSITKVSNMNVYFDPSKASNNDVIELTFYTNCSMWSAKEPIQLQWAEQLYRHASQLDRMDWGNWTPPYKWAVDQHATFDSLDWAWHQRLFFNHSGWVHSDDRITSSINAGSPIDSSKRTILSWYPNGAPTVGVFVGDPALNLVKDSNPSFVIQPIPFYLGALTFYCKMKNAGDADTNYGTAIQLDVTVDGLPETMGVSPGYTDSNDERIIKSRFGDDSNLMLSFGSMLPNDYSMLPATYKYGGATYSETDYSIVHKPIHCRAKSLNVSARVVGEDPSWDQVDNWYITFSGMITRAYTA